LNPFSKAHLKNFGSSFDSNKKLVPCSNPCANSIKRCWVGFGSQELESKPHGFSTQNWKTSQH